MSSNPQGSAAPVQVTTAEAAKRLGVSERTVRRWVKDGRLTNHGTDRHIRIDYFEILDNTPKQRAMRRLRDNLTHVPYCA